MIAWQAKVNKIREKKSPLVTDQDFGEPGLARVALQEQLVRPLRRLKLIGEGVLEEHDRRTLRRYLLFFLLFACALLLVRCLRKFLHRTLNSLNIIQVKPPSIP